MRFSAHNYYEGYFRRRNYAYLYQLLIRFVIIWTIAYLLTCVFLYFRQEYIIYQVNENVPVAAPGDRDFNLEYQNIWIHLPQSSERIHGWWFDSPSPQQPIVAIPNEPVNVLSQPKTILYLCGRGGSKTHYNNLARIQGFQQLGFSVLAFDYRGYGLSEGRLPNESRLYEDSQAAWDYLTQTKGIAAQDIMIYGESLGGAIAINLAVQQPEAAGLIVQSSFTSMAEQIRELRPGLSIFPLGLIVHQRFNSIAKVRSLQVPVLFIHGTADSIVDYKMSRQLYYAAPEPKTLFYIPGGEHLRLYQPGKYSYLLAIKDFVREQHI